MERLARIWVFAPIRRNEREWGTAVFALSLDDDRLEIHTARYFLITRGKKRGQNRVESDFVAESPADVVSDVLDKVQERSGDPEPPVEIDPLLWYPPEEEPEDDAEVEAMAAVQVLETSASDVQPVTDDDEPSAKD